VWSSVEMCSGDVEMCSGDVEMCSGVEWMGSVSMWATGGVPIYIPSRARGRVCVPLNGDKRPLNRYNMTNKWAILGTIIYRVLPITCSRL